MGQGTQESAEPVEVAPAPAYMLCHLSQLRPVDTGGLTCCPKGGWS
jgi:hypothetical protein